MLCIPHVLTLTTKGIFIPHFCKQFWQGFCNILMFMVTVPKQTPVGLALHTLGKFIIEVYSCFSIHYPARRHLVTTQHLLMYVARMPLSAKFHEVTIILISINNMHICWGVFKVDLRIISIRIFIVKLCIEYYSITEKFGKRKF